MKRFNKSVYSIALAAAAISLAACSDNDNDPVEEIVEVEPVPVVSTYEVSVVNLTAGQPASPIAVALHDSEMALWSVGESASDGLALLAESGDNSKFLANESLLVTASAENPTPPGESVVVSISIEDNDMSSITVASMLGNTNDAFTGFTGMDLSTLEVGDSVTHYTHAYDAGTEENTESAEDVPGPAAGGEGPSEGREAHDFVTLHPGVVTLEGGLSSSVLTNDQRFDNPVLKISVTRME